MFSREEYFSIIRPDVLLLKTYPDSEKFKNDKFWGRATLRSGEPVESGFKMKWHNLGPGRIQLRLCVALVKKTAFLCQAFVKSSKIRDKAQAALLLQRIDLIEQGFYEKRGNL